MLIGGDGRSSVERTQMYMRTFELARLGRRAVVAEATRPEDTRSEALSAAGVEVDASLTNDASHRRVPARHLQRAQFQRRRPHASGSCMCFPSRLCRLLGESRDDAELERSLASTSAAFLHLAFYCGLTGAFITTCSFLRIATGWTEQGLGP